MPVVALTDEGKILLEEIKTSIEKMSGIEQTDSKIIEASLKKMRDSMV